MNKKKLLIFGLPILCLVLISAALISHYGLFKQDITVQSPIEFDGGMHVLMNEWSNTEVSGNLMTVTNIAPFAIDVKIGDNAPEGHIDVSYVGTLELTEKVVDYSKNIWDHVNTNNVVVEYTLVGDEFSAEVVDGKKEGYVLVYYADNDDRFANPGQAVLVENVVGNLPGVNDENADLNDYSEEYPTTPFGAKIWYVPLDELIFDSGTNAYDVNWNVAVASTYYFETSLIQFNLDGEITVYPNEVLDFTPVYKLGSIEGTYSVTTFVDPVTA